MPLTPPIIDDRRYRQLLEETLARVPVHTPEWTNFNNSDPGVTLVQLFAFLTENLLYRATNQIPERNRQKFLQLLQVPLQTASAAHGLIAFSNERGEPRTQTLQADLEVRAGAISFRTEQGLDVLPVETRVFFKRLLVSPPAKLKEYYQLLYASYQKPAPLNQDINLYETVVLDSTVVDQVDINKDTVDQALWIAILAPKNLKPDNGTDPWKTIRNEIGERTLTVGLVPALDEVQISLVPGGQMQASELLVFEMPQLNEGRKIPRDADGQPLPSYRQLKARTEDDLLTVPCVVQLTLPPAKELGMWNDLDPLEAGVGKLPPTLEDSALRDRLITWLRIRATGVARARVLWVGINAVPVSQRERVIAEPLADGDGTPDQTRRLSRPPVLQGSVEVMVQQGNSPATIWTEIDDLLAAAPEIPVDDGRQAPGTPKPKPAKPEVFFADHEAGLLVFGDGLRGKRPPSGAKMFASYQYCQGAAGNVAAGAINNAPLLPTGLSVSNPVRTWGGADAESVADGEKQITRYLQHRDRLVSGEDFESIAWRTPGVNVGRIDVLPAFHPDLAPNQPGSAPGVVTLMAIPRFDPGQPDAPRADRLFLNAICRYLDPRRLVTTELILRGPIYKPIWISVGIDVAHGYSVAVVVDAVKQALRRFLAPVKTPETTQAGNGYAAQTGLLFEPASNAVARGWQLSMAVSARVLQAQVTRVDGVNAVADDLLLAEGALPAAETVEMNGLELPRVLGISVVAGPPAPIAALRGDIRGAAPAGSEGSSPASILPVPIVPESC
jgi:hypothetical protein